MDEQENIRSARQGSHPAFASLVEAYRHPIYNLCHRMLGGAEEADDATQETFLRAYTQLHSYDPNRPFKTWLFSIASHYCIDRLRRRRFTWIDIDDEPLAGHPALREHRLSPEDSAVKQERARDIERMLDTLTPKDRASVVMLYWYDLSYEEIADITDTTVSAVKSRLHRARATMAERLRPDEYGRGNFRREVAPPARPASASTAYSFSAA